MELCMYGCGDQANHTLKNGKKCCEPTFNQCVGYRAKLSAANAKMHAEGRGYRFTTADRNKSNCEKIDEAMEKAFVKNSTYSNEYIKPRFIKYYAKRYECFECGLTEWRGQEIILELDHIDGDGRNNLPENLRLLCLNCHGQTETFRGRNINTGLKKISDEAIIAAFREKGNIRQTLLHVGLSPRGANYERVKKLVY